MSDPAATNAPRAGRYYHALDGLRAFAVLAVVWHHTRPSDLANIAWTRGYLGVDVFFVISGFLITTLLRREQEATGTVALGAFWVRRALRLFPLWYAILLALTVVFAFVIPASPMGAPFFDELAYNATYTSNFIIGGTILSVSWSLAMEEQFYVVWPILMTRLRAAILPVALVATGLSVGVHLGAFDAVFAEWVGPRWKEHAAITATLLPLILGCGLVTIHERPWLRTITAPWTTAAWFAALIGVALLPIEEHFMRLGAQLAAAGLVASTLRGRHPILELGAVRWLGVRAYGIYLLHMLCRELLYLAGLAPGGNRGIEVFALTALTAILAAAVSYAVLEAPLLRLKPRPSTASSD